MARIKWSKKQFLQNNETSSHHISFFSRKGGTIKNFPKSGQTEEFKDKEDKPSSRSAQSQEKALPFCPFFTVVLGFFWGEIGGGFCVGEES